MENVPSKNKPCKANRIPDKKRKRLTSNCDVKDIAQCFNSIVSNGSFPDAALNLLDEDCVPIALKNIAQHSLFIFGTIMFVCKSEYKESCLSKFEKLFNEPNIAEDTLRCPNISCDQTFQNMALLTNHIDQFQNANGKCLKKNKSFQCPTSNKAPLAFQLTDNVCDMFLRIPDDVKKVTMINPFATPQLNGKINTDIEKEKYIIQSQYEEGNIYNKDWTPNMTLLEYFRSLYNKMKKNKGKIPVISNFQQRRISTFAECITFGFFLHSSEWV